MEVDPSQVEIARASTRFEIAFADTFEFTEDGRRRQPVPRV
jgi:hypothetical protein